MAFRIPGTDYEQRSRSVGVTEREFDKGANLVEGINGRDKMDTHFENTERVQVLDPRGDHTGRPMPRDARFKGAFNHGEWGPDQFDEGLEHGMDGPIEQRPYYGAGLPKRMDLMPNANPQLDRPTDDAAAGRPMGQGVGKKEV
jgi:hypothetical protein